MYCENLADMTKSFFEFVVLKRKFAAKFSKYIIEVFQQKLLSTLK